MISPRICLPHPIPKPHESHQMRRRKCIVILLNYSNLKGARDLRNARCAVTDKPRGFVTPAKVCIEETAMNVVEAKGVKIPAMGLGTMTLKQAVCVEAVKAALKLGYRNIDTAQNYGNEREVGEGIRASGVK